VTLYDRYVDWYGEPNLPVRAQLLDDGVLVARSTAPIAADSHGFAELRLSNVDGCSGCFPFGEIRPGHQLVLTAGAGPPITVTLRPIRADLDVERDRIGGLGWPDAIATLRLRRSGGRDGLISEEVRLDQDGRFSLDLASRQIDLRASDAGDIAYTDEGGNRVRTRVFVPSVHVDLGLPAPCTRLHGVSLQVEVRDPAGRTKYIDCAMPRDEAVQAGDMVTIYRGAGFLIPDAAPTVSLRVPALSADVDSLTDSLRVQGPPAALLRIEAGSAFGIAMQQDVRMDAMGTFSMAVPAEPARNARVVYDAMNGITVAASAHESSVLVGLRNLGLLTIFDDDSELLGANLTLSTAADEYKADIELKRAGWQEVPWEREWDDVYFEGGDVSANPGDRLTLEVDGSAPTERVVPDLMAIADAEANIITGTTPPGASVVVTFAGSSASDASHPAMVVKADAAGRFRAELPASIDLRPSMWGLVLVREQGTPFAFYTLWYVQRHQLDLTTGVLTGTGSLSDTVQVQLVSATGELKLSGATTAARLLSLMVLIPNRVGWAFATVTDPASDDTVTRAGDMFEVRTRDTVSRLTVPTVDYSVDEATDEIRGEVSPGYRTRLLVSARPDGSPSRRSAGLARELVVAADGRFSVRLGGQFDLQAGDVIELRLTDSLENEVVHRYQLPYMEVMLDNGWISGGHMELRRGIPLLADLEREGRSVARVRGETGTQSSRWAFLVPLRDGTGSPMIPRPGDRLAMSINEPPQVRLDLDIPDLSVDMDWAQARLRGRLGTPGILELQTGYTVVYPAIEADGTFDTPIDRPGATDEWASPGRIAIVRLYLPSGHVVARRFVFPRLSVESGGARVEALVPPLSEVRVDLVDAGGQVIAAASGRAKEYLDEGLDGDRTDNTFLVLQRGQEPVRIKPGQRVRVTVDGLETSVEVPELTAVPDWEAELLTGTGPPEARFAIALQNDRSCWLSPGFSWDLPTSTRTWRSQSPLKQDRTGHFFVEPFNVAPGQRFMVGFLSASGHRIYRTVMRASAQIDAKGGAIEGCAQPLEAVTADLLDEGGQTLARSQAIAGSDARYRMQFRSDDGEYVPVRPTDKVRLCSANECVTLPVRPVMISFNPTQITGKLGPNQPGYLMIVPIKPFADRPSYPQLEGGFKAYYYPLLREVAQSERGDVTVSADEVAGWNLPWNLDDVQSVRLWSQIEPGRYVVATAQDVAMTYLPFVTIHRPQPERRNGHLARFGSTGLCRVPPPTPAHWGCPWHLAHPI
jgi:hypothetical protein